MPERFIEIIEENKVDGKSMPSYYGFDGKPRYMNAYESVAEAQSAGGDIDLKTINETSLKGTGNISLVSSVKTVNGQTMTGSGNVSTQVPVVIVSGATPTQDLSPNTFYKFGDVDSLTLTLGSISDESIMNVYTYSFTASSNFDPSTSTFLPSNVVLNGEFDIDEGQTCEISIFDGRAAFMVWDAPELPEAEAEAEGE